MTHSGHVTVLVVLGGGLHFCFAKCCPSFLLSLCFFVHVLTLLREFLSFIKCMVTGFYWSWVLLKLVVFWNEHCKGCKHCKWAHVLALYCQHETKAVLGTCAVNSCRWCYSAPERSNVSLDYLCSLCHYDKVFIRLGGGEGLRWPEEDIFMKNSRAGNLETNGFSGFY